MLRKILFFVSLSFIFFENFAQNVGVGVSNPSYRLDIADRIRLRGGGTNETSPGIWLNNINNSGLVGFMGVYNDNYMGWYGNSGASWTLMMNVSNGNIGIGNQNPAFKLDISDRMRIRSGAGASTAGIYFNKADNSTAQAFVGMRDDNYVGLFGVPLNNWGLLMNTSNGNVGLGNNTSPQALLHIVKGQRTNGPLLSSSAAVIEGDQGGWLQLSNNNNIEGGILSGNQVTAIRSAVIFGADSSLQLRSGGNFTRLSLAKTGEATFSQGITVSGEVMRPSTGSANLVPICYGSVNVFGIRQGGTSNFSAEYVFNGLYRITITGVNYNEVDYCVFITPISALDASTRFRTFFVAESSDQPGKIEVGFGNPTTGSYATTAFNFIVYKL